jgi:hypothetical protein
MFASYKDFQPTLVSLMINRKATELINSVADMKAETSIDNLTITRKKFGRSEK